MVRRGLAALAVFAGSWALLRWATEWGSTFEERATAMPGDAYLDGSPPAGVSMTRAITISRPPEEVWPWLAQLGRGAGWYSFDLLDNGGRPSARHIVSWIPEPAVGDATAIGYLREVEPGASMSWWLPGQRWLGALVRMMVDIELRPLGAGSRVVIRVSSDASGGTAIPTIVAFQVIDSIMAIRQLLGIRHRAESEPVDDETGARDQYQYYEVLYTGGGGAGVPGKEKGRLWYQRAIEDGLIMAGPDGVKARNT